MVFEMRASGKNELKLKWSPQGLPPEAPVPGWWKLNRESDSSQGVIMPGGPIGGVVAGVVNGAKAGVPGGVKEGVGGAIPGGVSGGVVQGVSDGTVHGVSAGVLGGVSGLPGRGRAVAEYKGNAYALGPRVRQEPEEPQDAPAPDEGKPEVKVHGKVTFTGLSGTVYDASGARVPDAVVAVSNLDAKIRKTVATDEEGSFGFEGLPEGRYQVEVSKPGFALYQQRGVVLDASKPAPELSVVLALGEISQMVTITGKAPGGAQPAAAEPGPKRIRVGGQVEAAKLIFKPEPEYPESLREKGIQGLVLLEGVISKEGEPLSFKVLKSPDPGLAQAALDAVQQWRYQPTLLNGEPVEVVTTIEIEFDLEP